MDFLTSTTNWNNLPIEVKLMVVKHLELSSRLTLRSCSVSEFQLVESVPFRKIHEIQLREYSDTFSIESYENYYSRCDDRTFKSFDEFQENLISIFNTVDYIGQLSIFMKNSTAVLKLNSGMKKVKVGKMIIPNCNAEALIRQVDASVLKCLNIRADDVETSAELYDLPQVKSIEDLRINSGLIQDHQLMLLTPKFFQIISPRSLTSSGICNFIRKCAANPNFEKLEFLWLGIQQFRGIYYELFTSSDPESKQFTINPSFPEFDIRLREADNMIVMRRRKISSIDALLKPRKINDMIIALDNGFYKLVIIEKHDNRDEWSFNSFEELQECLTMKMRNINYIKRLEIQFEQTFQENTVQENTRSLRFTPAENSKQITVGHVKLHNCERSNGQATVEMLEQIEPGYLKRVNSDGEMICNQVYDLQQVIQAEFISSTHSDVRDDQILKLNAEKLYFTIARDELYDVEILTPSGTNKYIKKCLLNLKNKNYEFKLIHDHEINWSEYGQFISDLLEGLDIFTMKTDQNIRDEAFPSEVVLNSEWDGIKLELMIDENYVKGTRIEV